MSEFLNKHGLLNAFPGEVVSENTLLISLVYYLLQQKVVYNSAPIHLDLHRDLVKYVELCKTSTDGLYNNLPEGTEYAHDRDRPTSPDQLLSYCLVLYLAGDTHQLQLIWRWLKRHWMTYDNIKAKTNFKRTMQPSAVFTSAYCAGGHWAAFPLICSIVYSVERGIRKESTSGIQKAWMVDSVLHLDMLKRNFQIKKYLKIYYGHGSQKDHPINLIMEHV
jgi:hypothetical protein